MKDGKNIVHTGVLLLLAFALWTVLVLTVDVQTVGMMGSNIGFATLNGWFHRLTGVHLWLYTVTDWLGLVPLFVCLLFAAVGFIQLVRRKNLRKVDLDIILLGAYYAVVMFCYLIFEMLPINYRPILMEGRMEASYPSSTTLLVLSVMPTLVFQVRCRLQSVSMKTIITCGTMLFSAFMVVGRLASGVHWFTDIVGSVLLSAGLFCVYRGCVRLYCREH